MSRKPVPSLDVMIALDGVDTGISRAIRSVQEMEEAAGKLGIKGLQSKLHRLKDILQDSKTASNLAQAGG